MTRRRTITTHRYPSNQQPPPPFLNLPPEIHALIADELPYPDLLSLTLSHPLFTTHPQIRTTKTTRVDWLLSRATQHLPLPTQTRCRWSSDREFVNNPEVASILRRRRQHAECAEVWEKGHSAGECLVLGGKEMCGRIGKEASRKEGRWIERVRWQLGGLDGYVMEVRSGVRRPSGVLDLMKSKRIAVVVIVIACFLYLLI